jgi:hypothetical protein
MLWPEKVSLQFPLKVIRYGQSILNRFVPKTKVSFKIFKVDLHFVAFVNVEGDLYELDGRKDGPLNLGPIG